MSTPRTPLQLNVMSIAIQISFCYRSILARMCSHSEIFMLSTYNMKMHVSIIDDPFTHYLCLISLEQILNVLWSNVRSFDACCRCYCSNYCNLFEFQTKRQILQRWVNNVDKLINRIDLLFNIRTVMLTNLVLLSLLV